jgi:ATP-binding cassette, subfamily B, bacterial
LLRRVLQPHARGEARVVASGVALGVFAVVLEVLRPWPLKWMLDAAIDNGLAGLEASLLRYATMFAVVAIVAAAANRQHVLLLHHAVGRIVHALRADLRRRVLEQSLAFHDRHDVGELQTRIVSDTARLRRGMTGAVSRVARAAVLFGATFVALAVADVLLALVMAVGGAIAVLLMRLRGRRIAKAARRQRIREGRLAALVHDELHAVRELQIAGMSMSDKQSAFAQGNERSRRREEKVERLTQGLAFRVDVVFALSVAVAVAWGAWHVASSTATAGDLLLFLSYALGIRAPLMDLAQQTARVGRVAACAERIARLQERMRVAPSITPRTGVEARARVASDEGVRLEGVTLRAPRRSRSGRKLRLHDVSFAIPAGQRVALVGGNGAGKSSVLSLVLGLLEPTSGRVVVDGVDLSVGDRASLRRTMSVVLQAGVLPGLSIRDNVALGLSGIADDAIWSALEAAGARALVERLPRGLDTRIRRSGTLLSGGERQRVAVARALLRDGAFWVLDEPTTGLDEASADGLTSHLLAVTHGRTTLWVTHEVELVRRLDWCLELSAGHVVFSGPSALWQPTDAAAVSTLLSA